MLLCVYVGVGAAALRGRPPRRPRPPLPSACPVLTRDGISAGLTERRGHGGSWSGSEDQGDTRDACARQRRSAHKLSLGGLYMNRLTVLVGAGASQALGLPGTNDVLEYLLEKEAELIAEGTIRPTLYPPIFETVLNLLRQHHENPNFEHLMHALECLVSILNTDAAPRGRHQSMELLFTNGISTCARELSTVPHVPDLAITYLINWLCNLFENASATTRERHRWPAYQDFWTAISQNFTLDIATFNYDTCIELALPDLDQGFKPVEGSRAQRFDGLSFQRTEDSRLMHLHGSIHLGKWDLKSGIGRFAYEDNWHDLYYYPNARDAAMIGRAGAQTEPISQSGRHTIIGPVITGLQKPDKILSVEPYASYYHTFVDCLRSSPRLLIVGYGFGDTYINQLLSRMSRWHGAARRIACIDYTPPWIDAPETRNAPAWIRNGMLPRWTGSDKSLSLIDTRMIESTPWYASGGMFMLDCAGLLARPTQADEILRFLAS
ncbi:SIR2 family protein [Sorangium sp. So ce1099]|uniref:SIR2 family protein n=1 Tax=Sorangium sp. So ce1099 TaxID=3133331 RepID=UPI003F63A3F3